METRVELWKKYREAINKNNELKKAVLVSNKKLNILYTRLIKAYPEYEKKYIKEDNIKKFVLNKVGEPTLSKGQVVEEMLNGIKIIEKDFGGSFDSINNIDFSSHELNDIIINLKKGKIKQMEYYNEDKTKDINIIKPKLVNIGGSMSKLNIAIDGPSGSGKSTVAKLIAKQYGYTYINTGLVYRAIALYCINNIIDVSDSIAVSSMLKSINIDLKQNEVVILNDEEVTKEVRSDEVSSKASIVASIIEVREWAVMLQQKFAEKKGIVMDGRDTTFVVLPNADIKIFLDTDVAVRAKRRQEQNEKLGFSTNYNKILKELEVRDHRDRTREKDPLHKTKDAILIDSSEISINKVVAKISRLVEEKLKEIK